MCINWNYIYVNTLLKILIDIARINESCRNVNYLHNSVMIILFKRCATKLKSRMRDILKQ